MVIVSRRFPAPGGTGPPAPPSFAFSNGCPITSSGISTHFNHDAVMVEPLGTKPCRNRPSRLGIRGRLGGRGRIHNHDVGHRRGPAVRLNSRAIAIDHLAAATSSLSQSFSPGL